MTSTTTLPFEALYKHSRTLSFSHEDPALAGVLTELHAGGASPTGTARLELGWAGDRVRVKGSLSVQLGCACSRCLAPVSTSIEAEWTCDVVHGAPPRSSEAEAYELSMEELDTIFVEEPVVDLAALVREQVILEQPTWVACGEDASACESMAGAEAEGVLLSADTKTRVSPFAALASLHLDDVN